MNQTTPVRPPARTPFVMWLASTVAVTSLVGLGAWVSGSRLYRYGPLEDVPAVRDVRGDVDAQTSRVLEAKAEESERLLRSMIPRSVHIVVDTANNRLFVRKGEEVILEAVCSTGSGGRLTDPNDGRRWIFETPRGTYRVRAKARDPVWTKPDWAFIEEDKPVPKKWSERRDSDTLGDYALYFGDGYMIHGTLYQRYLGRAITHGCVRLGDADLERVYEMTPVGTPIYIY